MNTYSRLRCFGIDTLSTIKATTDHWTVLSLIFAIAVTAWFLGPEIGLGIFIGIAWHEQGHLVAGRRFGCETAPTRFFPFVGGMARFKSLPQTGKQYAIVSLAGPFYGLLLAFLLALLGILCNSSMLLRMAGLHSMINLFNLIPIFPLDGGRMAKVIGQSLCKVIGLLVPLLSAIVAFVYAVFSGHLIFALVSYWGLREFNHEVACSITMGKLLRLREMLLTSEERAQVETDLASLQRMTLSEMSGRDTCLSALCWFAMIPAFVLIIIGTR